MATINEIITGFREDLEKINQNNKYKTNPSIYYGVFRYNEVGHYPAICFADEGININQLFGDDGYGYINILLYGYAEHDGLEDTSNIRDLAMDSLLFLFEDFRYSDDTQIIENIDILPGGNERPVSVFSIDLKVKFDFKKQTINR